MSYKNITFYHYDFHLHGMLDSFTKQLNKITKILCFKGNFMQKSKMEKYTGYSIKKCFYQNSKPKGQKEHHQNLHCKRILKNISNKNNKALYLLYETVRFSPIFSKNRTIFHHSLHKIERIFLKSKNFGHSESNVTH